MIYFDNAATTFPKPREVTQEVNNCLQKYCGNPGRSGHKLSIRASEEIYAVREKVANHLNLQTADRVVFTQNATYALNIAIQGLIREKCHIIISDIEHNSVIRPIHALVERYGCEISIFHSDTDLYRALIPLIREDTRYIVCTSTSNVTGKNIDIYTLSDIAGKYNLSLILDLSQTIGHVRIDADRMHFSALCAPGHKGLYGIQGSGFVIFGKDAKPRPLIYGGSGAESRSKYMPETLPEAIEAGTLSTPSIVSLGRGIEYIEKYGLKNVAAHHDRLTELCRDRLENLTYVRLLSAQNGIVCFNVEGYSSEQVSARLNKRNIAVRGGLHCAPFAHERLGTLDKGAVRASFSIFNKPSEINRFYNALRSEFQ